MTFLGFAPGMRSGTTLVGTGTTAARRAAHARTRQGRRRRRMFGEEWEGRLTRTGSAAPVASVGGRGFGSARPPPGRNTRVAERWLSGPEGDLFPSCFLPRARRAGGPSHRPRESAQWATGQPRGIPQDFFQFTIKLGLICRHAGACSQAIQLGANAGKQAPTPRVNLSSNAACNDHSLVTVVTQLSVRSFGVTTMALTTPWCGFYPTRRGRRHRPPSL